MTSEDKTALSYWFPKIEAAGLPVPKTTIVPMPLGAQKCIWAAFDGNDGKSEELASFRDFIGNVGVAAEALGFPCFIRTDHTSGKHQWERTCFLATVDDIRQHVFEIAEFSECASIIGLPWNTWVVREFLPTIPIGVCPDYGNMPVCREFRFFVDDGVVRCHHAYWPKRALDNGAAINIDYDELCRMPNEDELMALASAAGRAVGGSWSVDILETKRGWFVTDMAETHKSYHWEGCPKGEVA